MKKYLVNLPLARDFQYQQCLDLLIQEGYIDSENRQYHSVRQWDGSYKEQGFLYLFETRAKAEEFAEKLRGISNEPDWDVFEIDTGGINELVEEHRALRDQPLVLAMLFDSGKDPRNLYLLEVISNFGLNEVSPDRELFEVSFPFPGMLSPDGKDLHLVLTNPTEFGVALNEDWEWAKVIKRAVKEGRFEVLYMSEANTRD